MNSNPNMKPNPDIIHERNRRALLAQVSQFLTKNEKVKDFWL